MKPFHPKHALTFVISLLAVRWLAHFVVFRDGVAIAELVGVDIGATVVLLLSAMLGPNVGKHLGSILTYALVVGLTAVGVGYLAQTFGSRHLSQMSGFISILGAGTGLCLATTRINEARWLMGLLAVGGGTYGLTQIHQPLDALLIASPYVVASVVFVVTGAGGKRS
jgi:hypothetical protein